MSNQEKDPKKPNQPPTSRWGRLAKLGALAPKAIPLAIAGARSRMTQEGMNEEELEKAREHVKHEARKTAEAMLKTLGEMKGLPLKLGQMASYIDGLAPPGYEEKFQEVLKNLQSKAPPLSPEAAEKVIFNEFGLKPQDLFAEFEREPFAAASIGQVHKARLKSGEWVAVKVQYPGIDRAIENDLKTVTLLEQMMAPIGRRYQTKESVEEIRRVFTQELDYTYEARAAEAFRSMFEGDSRILIPRVYHSFTTKRVLTTEFFHGVDYQTFATSSSWSERNAAGIIIWTFMFRALYEYGVLYADPHPGNYRFFVDLNANENIKVGFLDFGCIRVLSDRMVAGMKQVLLAKMYGTQEDFDRALVEVYGFDPTDAEGWPIYKGYTEYLIRSVTLDETFEHSPEVARENIGWIARNRRKIVWKEGETLPHLPKPIHMPVEHTFVNRLQWGLASILGGLGAAHNFHRLTLPWVQSLRRAPKGLDIPPPM